MDFMQCMSVRREDCIACGHIMAFSISKYWCTERPVFPLSRVPLNPPASGSALRHNHVRRINDVAWSRRSAQVNRALAFHGYPGLRTAHPIGQLSLGDVNVDGFRFFGFEWDPFESDQGLLRDLHARRNVATRIQVNLWDGVSNARPRVLHREADVDSGVSCGCTECRVRERRVRKAFAKCKERGCAGLVVPAITHQEPLRPCNSAAISYGSADGRIRHAKNALFELSCKRGVLRAGRERHW